MALTAQQWDKVEEDCMMFHTHVELTDGETKLTIQKYGVAENRQNLVVFINGNLSLLSGFPDREDYLPETELYWRKRSKAIFSEKQKNAWIKIYGKRRAYKKMDLDGRVCWYDPFFPTFKSLKAVLSKLPNLQLAQESEHAS